MRDARVVGRASNRTVNPAARESLQSQRERGHGYGNERARNRILAVLFLGVLMGALDIAIVGPALPAIQTTFGVSERAIAWVFTIYVLFNLVGTPLMARLSDSSGRRSAYVLCVGLFAIGSLVVAVSPAFEVMLVGRAVQGLGAGGIFPVASAVIGDTFPPERRGRALGMIGAVFGVAFLLGPLLGGLLLSFSWHWLFLVNLPVAAVVIVAALRLLPTFHPARRAPFDWPGMLVLGTLLACLTYGLNQIDTTRFVQSLTSAQVWPFLLGALAMLPVFWVVERRSQRPVLRVSLFASRQVALAATFALGAGIGEASVVFVPKLLKAAFGVSESQASFMLLPVVLAMGAGSPLAGRALDRYGSRVVVFAGNLLVGAGMLVAGLFATRLALFYLAAGLVGVGLGVLLGAPLRYIMLGEAAASERASAQGALTLFTSIGQMVGGTLVGAIAASRGGGVPGYEEAYLVVGLMALALAVMSVGLKGRAEELAAVRGPASPAGDQASIGQSTGTG
jgi:EmrB/QacA subfamily drug resistance transporter